MTNTKSSRRRKHLHDLEWDKPVQFKETRSIMPRPRRKDYSLSQSNNMAYMYGGLVKEEPQSELFEMNLNELKEWNLVETEGFKPPPLFNHTSTIVEGVLYIIGGCTASGIFNSSMYCFDICM